MYTVRCQGVALEIDSSPNAKSATYQLRDPGQIISPLQSSISLSVSETAVTISQGCYEAQMQEYIWTISSVPGTQW